MTIESIVEEVFSLQSRRELPELRMAGSTSSKRREQAIKRAAALMTEALDLLDAHGGPADAAAHLDLALQKVREAMKL